MPPRSADGGGTISARAAPLPSSAQARVPSRALFRLLQQRQHALRLPRWLAPGSHAGLLQDLRAVSAAVSAAKSASRIRLRDASRFSLTAVKFAIVDSKRFWMAPNVLRRPLTAVSAASTRVIAVFAFATVVTDAVASAEVPRASDAAV